MPTDKTVTVFKFSELSDDAKERAKNDHCAAMGYAWADESLTSIKALAEHFGGQMNDWSIDWFNSAHSSAKFDMPELSVKEIRELLKELGSYNRRTLKGHGDCKLTGFCHDESAIDGFRIAFIRDKERDLDELMRAAFESWLSAVQADAEAEYSDEQFSEMADANGYTYRENGELE